MAYSGFHPVEELGLMMLSNTIGSSAKFQIRGNDKSIDRIALRLSVRPFSSMIRGQLTSCTARCGEVLNPGKRRSTILSRE